MNPRVSRSSALASKATGFPIAKIAAKLAIGYTLDEIPNDITRKTPAAFEPALDYVVVKMPRFAFEKFPGADPELTTTMKSVGEAMSLGPQLRRGAEQGAAVDGDQPTAGFWTTPGPGRRHRGQHPGRAAGAARRPALHGGAGAAAGRARWPRSPRRPASTRGSSTRSRRWSSCARRSPTRRCSTSALLRRAKRAGLSDRQLAALRPELAGEDGVRSAAAPARRAAGLQDGRHLRRRVRRHHPYHYSSYDEETEVAPSDRPKVLILGSGPNRIGQGIEFDYSCVHAVMALSARRQRRAGRLRDRDGQLQPGDRLDRLRHRRPALLRAADVRGRARGRARRAHVRPGRRRPGRGRRDRAARRADPARPGAAAQGRRRADRRHLAGVDPPGRGPRRVRRGAGRGRPASRRPTAPPPRSTRPRRSPTRSATRCWSGRPTCSAAGAWRSSTTTTRCATTSTGPPRSRRRTRCWSTGSSTTPSRSTWTRSATPPARSTSAA